ncbi:hypothetical protein JET76_01060 [Pseudomonas putida]|uniref:Uncharacterized protein n=1 Tax=Pseudomonas putida TaxID=303 RepID=A0A7W2KYR2_PSEPU|nr:MULTISPECIES: hypothetical protein [Pseudomonas]MBA6115307.1 hypothetical protein [Pseudomonas putida]MBI6939921.1 hypothetical protein [Pseudomonas putida]MBI6956109.1 hypothetical protein [Pseudomonas putida]MCZ9639489.1 hypothetical protein [Pseudomonas putida]MEC4878108.1 hypothetical protein [Pseudomonas sp. NC26]
MTAFYLKFLITPTLMLVISLASKRWGSKIGGLLSGLPVTSALVMLFLSLEQGPGFALQAVPGALAGLAAVQATYLFYFLVTRRVGAFAGCLMALAVYAATAFVISRLAWVALSVAVTLLLLTVIIVVTSPKAQGSAANIVPLPRWVIPMRMLTATLLLLAITASAQWLGPVASGLLAPIPVIAWPLAVFAHVQGGHQELGAIVRGNAIGAVGVLGFYLAVKASIVALGTVPAIAAAVVLAVVATFALARVLDRR